VLQSRACEVAQQQRRTLAAERNRDFAASACAMEDLDVEGDDSSAESMVCASASLNVPSKLFAPPPTTKVLSNVEVTCKDD